MLGIRGYLELGLREGEGGRDFIGKKQAYS